MGVGRSGQTAMEYLLMVTVAIVIVVSVWLFMSASKQGTATSTTLTLRDAVISPDLTGGRMGVCTPNCAGKDCGPDGCAGNCGVCGASETCNAAGVCELLKCSDGTFYGACSTAKPKYCESGSLIDKCATCGCPNPTDTCNADGSCTPAAVCSNGIIEGIEQCDGSALGGKTCATQGFSGGTLACTASCTFNTANCYTCGSNGCESAKGENAVNCLADCHCPDTSCNSGETYFTCTADCPWSTTGSYWTGDGGSGTCSSGYAMSNHDCTGDCGGGKDRMYCLKLPPGVTTGTATWTGYGQTASCPSGSIAIGFTCFKNDCGKDTMSYLCAPLQNAKWGSSSVTGDTNNQHECNGAATDFVYGFDCTGKCGTGKMKAYCVGLAAP